MRLLSEPVVASVRVLLYNTVIDPIYSYYPCLKKCWRELRFIDKDSPTPSLYEQVLADYLQKVIL